MQTPNNNVTLKRIKQISVKNLFGMFNHVIPLHLDERVTIIHGPNGFGKTIILRLLKALFQGNNSVLRKIPFDEFCVEFGDETSLWVTKTYQASPPSLESADQEEIHEMSSVVPIVTFHTIGETSFQLPPITSLPPNHLDIIDRRIPTLRHIDRETWLYAATNEILTLDMVLERFGDLLPGSIAYEKQPEWLTKLRKSVEIHFIETQRLLDTKRSRERIYNTPQFIMVPTVQMYSEEIATIIKAKLAESSDLSQSLDKTFPARVFNPKSEHTRVTFNELRKRLAAINEKREKLSTIGLLDDDNSSGPAFQIEDEVDESKKIMLAVYVEDTEKKLGIFDDLAAKIDLLTRIINKRFL